MVNKEQQGLQEHSAKVFTSKALRHNLIQVRKNVKAIALRPQIAGAYLEILKLGRSAHYTMSRLCTLLYIFGFFNQVKFL
ncbi:hypothetical protein AQUCO_00100446v1 [Aquilegia coerulea]|uniref:Uncharacterized protein n=1 Tax=Aquilegia coerulea TaxID=218851 RepID=A0A2G5FAP2_AQUCA|nr:hypothetical protein AQUCO_00100446v1 [Aquilegia coerulea]